jgi:flavin-dependent dehydrogenase
MPDRYAAIQAAFDLASAEPFYGAVFDSALTDFYCWTIPKGGSLLVGGAFPQGVDARVRFDELVTKLRDHGMRFGREMSRSSAQIARPSRPGHLFVGTGRVLLVGEAAGFVSPSSAEGISYALSSAASLAGALEAGIDGAQERYLARAWPLALKVAAKAVKGGAIYGTATRRLVMRSGIGGLATPSGTPAFQTSGRGLLR